MSWVKIGCGLRGGIWGRIFLYSIQCGQFTMANIYRPKILFIVMLWFDQLLKRAWSNKIRSHISRVKRLEFASECEPLFLGQTLNSRQKKKNIFKCCDYFHFSPLLDLTFFVILVHVERKLKMKFEWLVCVVVDTFGALWFLLTF